MKPTSLSFATGLALMLPGAAFAASTTAPTGVSAGFFQMYQDWSLALSGDLGALILLFGVILSAIMAIFMQRFVMAGMTFLAAFLIGYGLPIFTSSAGVTAGIDMVELSEPSPIESAKSLPVHL